MSFIAPNTTIKFIQNCPLERNYQHTLYWENTTAGKNAQTAYFNSIVKTPTSKYTLNNQSYQRSNKGSMRVQLKMEDLIDCNYLMFQNTSFENKWFYAFINKVDYVSNDVCEVSYTIDVMQTWYFDYTLKQCFVEREHSSTDVSGDNLQPENINVGNYISNGGTILMHDDASRTNTPKVMLVTAFNQGTFESFKGTSYDGIYSCLDFRVYTKLELTQFLNEMFDEDPALWDEIIDCVVVPPNFVYTDSSLLTTKQEQLKYVAKFNENYTGTYGTGSSAMLDGYVPRNNKLFTYPYNFVRFSNDVDSIDCAYELFPKGTGTYANSMPMWLYNILYPNPTCVLDLYSYQMKDNGYGVLIGEPQTANRLEINGFPECAIAGDIYKIYYGQMTSSFGVKTALSTGSQPFSTKSYQVTGKANNQLIELGNQIGASSNPILALTGLVAKGLGKAGNWLDSIEQNLINKAKSSVSTMVNNVLETESPLPERTAEVKGTQTSVADFNCGYKLFKYNYMSIRKEQAERIDSYFDRFGYATNKTKVPNISVRPEWNYVKTLGCLIDGAMPSDDEEEIQSIYDAGITFWKNPAHVGDYSQNNKLT